ncbi:heme-binding protein [Elizabethkingia anophelis]|uniref:heme-degrading domain-containing protein n=1 Tax=Elizabethkingia anophelis TaxID=1117645 RepID=UPI00293538B5|nr:hypothetical protein [Elizabethkingia anophelis]
MEIINLEQFNNRIAFEIGTKVIDLAKSRNQYIAIEIIRLNHTVFLYVDDTLSMDKNNWLRRKSNVSKQFGRSSLSVKNSLLNSNTTLYEKYGLNENDYTAKGGSIPIFVKEAGMVALITVSGLQDEEDHNIIIEALENYLK